MYLCAEEYVLPDGSQRERQGLIALCRLEPYERGIVLPHEETSPHPKRMLFDLRSAVEANLDQVFALYADDSGKLQEILTAQRSTNFDKRWLTAGRSSPAATLGMRRVWSTSR